MIDIPPPELTSKSTSQTTASLKHEGPHQYSLMDLNHLTPNGHYMGRTAQLISRCCILYIYSANIRTE